MFNQILEPAGQSLALTILAALVPLIVLLFLLAVVRMTAWLSTIIASLVTVIVGGSVWKAPAALALKAYLYGSLQAWWPIDSLGLWALVSFNTCVLRGDLDHF